MDKQKLQQLVRSAVDSGKWSARALSLEIGYAEDWVRDFLSGKGGLPRADRLPKLLKAIGYDSNDIRLIPIWGDIPAGTPLYISDYRDADLQGEVEWHDAPKGAFALRVRENCYSMDNVAPPGHLILVDPNQTNPQLLDGKYVVVNLEEGCTFKRLCLNPLRLEPDSRSTDYQTRYLEPTDKFTIVGMVHSTQRKLA